MEIKRQIIESKTPPGNKEVWWFDTSTESLKRYSRGKWELVPFSDDANNEVPLSDTVIETTYEQAKKLYESGNMVPGVQYKFTYNQKQVINDEIVAIEFPLFVWYDGKSLKCNGQYDVFGYDEFRAFTADYSFDPKFIYIKKPVLDDPNSDFDESPEIIKRTVDLIASDDGPVPIDTLYSDLKSSGLEFALYPSTEGVIRVTLKNATVFMYTGNPYTGEDENVDYMCIMDSKGNYVAFDMNHGLVYRGHDSISTSAGFVYNLYYTVGGNQSLYQSYIIDGETPTTRYCLASTIFEQDIDQFPLSQIDHSDYEVTCSNIVYIKQSVTVDESLGQQYSYGIVYIANTPIINAYENN